MRLEDVRFARCGPETTRRGGEHEIREIIKIDQGEFIDKAKAQRKGRYG